VRMGCYLLNGRLQQVRDPGFVCVASLLGDSPWPWSDRVPLSIAEFGIKFHFKLGARRGWFAALLHSCARGALYFLPRHGRWIDNPGKAPAVDAYGNAGNGGSFRKLGM